MAQKNVFSVTATKIMDGPKQAVIYSNATGKVITLIREQIKSYEAHGSEDTIFQLVDGGYVIGQEEYADVNTDVSATDISGS